MRLPLLMNCKSQHHTHHNPRHVQSLNTQTTLTHLLCSMPPPQTVCPTAGWTSRPHQYCKLVLSGQKTARTGAEDTWGREREQPGGRRRVCVCVCRPCTRVCVCVLTQRSALVLLVLCWRNKRRTISGAEETRATSLFLLSAAFTLTARCTFLADVFLRGREEHGQLKRAVEIKQE